MSKHNIYVQDINYPTVARGEEKLRIAPSPHHTDEMRTHFVNSVVDIWHELDLPFTRMDQQCSHYGDYETLDKMKLDFNLPLAVLM